MAAKLTGIRWDNPLSHDANLLASMTLCFPINEDEIEAFLYDAYGYNVTSFNLDRIDDCDA